MKYVACLLVAFLVGLGCTNTTQIAETLTESDLKFTLRPPVEAVEGSTVEIAFELRNRTNRTLRLGISPSFELHAGLHRIISVAADAGYTGVLIIGPGEATSWVEHFELHECPRDAKTVRFIEMRELFCSGQVPLHGRITVYWLGSRGGKARATLKLEGDSTLSVRLRGEGSSSAIFDDDDDGRQARAASTQ
jgi:hypothetical protein